MHLSLANLESNENHVFYSVYDARYEGDLLRGLDGYGAVGTGFGAGTGAGTVQVRYGYGTWVRSVPYPCTVPTFERTKSDPYPNSGYLI